MEFESRLARRVERRARKTGSWTAYLGTAAAVFLVVNFTAGSLGAPSAVVHVGTQDSVAKYLGLYDGKTSVIMLGTVSVDDWVCVKVPFKGRLSDVQSISFSVFVSRPGGDAPHEPFVVVRMTEGRNLVCHPPLSYEAGDWTLPVSEWQLREVVVKGVWTDTPTDGASSVMSFDGWQATLGNANVLSVNLYVGAWETTSPYVCYVGDLSVNGHCIGLSNAGRCASSNGEMPEGF